MSNPFSNRMPVSREESFTFKHENLNFRAIPQAYADVTAAPPARLRMWDVEYDGHTIRDVTQVLPGEDQAVTEMRIRYELESKGYLKS